MASLHHPPHRLPGRAAARLLVTLLVVPALACVAERKSEPLPGNLLAGASIQTGGVPNTDRLTDGTASQEGDFWDTPVSARFERPDATVSWDLGQAKPIRCALLQGDNNDNYLLSGSLDGKEWKPLWQAPAVVGAGMRMRHGKLEGNARYVRLSADGGDSLYSVGEVAIFSDCPAGWPNVAALVRAEVIDPNAAGGAGGGVWTVSLGLFALALVVFIVLTRRRSEPPRIKTPQPDDLPPVD